VRIGELAQATGVSAPLLRYYEAQGLLSPTRTTNGYRHYDEHAATTVRQVRGLLKAGLPTHEIRLLLPCATTSTPELEPCSEVLQLLRARLSGLDDRIESLRRARDALQAYLSAAETAATARPSRPARPQALPPSVEDCLHQWRTASDRGRPAGTTQT
jgi:DNA-binding transcriptional MerR regulator